MNKVFIILAILSLLVLSSCSDGEQRVGEPGVTSGEDVTVTEPKMPSAEQFVVDIDRIGLGSWGIVGDIEVGSYTNGQLINKDTPGFEPFYIVNRINEYIEMKSVKTDPGEFTAGIPIRRDLYGADVSSVTVTSDLPDEELTVVGYDSAEKLVVIDGFVADESRVLTVTYTPNLVFATTVSNKHEPRFEGFVRAPDGFEAWVEIENPVVSLGPDSYAPVFVSLNVPEGVELPNKWEFWVKASLIPEYNIGTVTTKVEEGESTVVSRDPTTGARVTSELVLGASFRVVMR